MIIGLGIDTTEIDRFTHWYEYDNSVLKRIFSEEEIIYCRQKPHLSAERFAVRFAAREAFFKAWHSAFPNHYIPLLTLCKNIAIIHGPHNLPELKLDAVIFPNSSSLITRLSFTHTRTSATASAIIFQP